MSARLAAGFRTRPEAAASLSMALSTYESHENGRRATKGIPTENARQYARRFKVSLSWLLTGQGDRNLITAVEIKGFIGAGAEIEDLDGSAHFEELGVTVGDPDDLEWFEVRGDSMEPRVYEGEFIAFEKREYQPQQFLRQECLVYLDDNRRFFKKLSPGSAPGLYDLVSYNDKTRQDERVVRVGKVAMIVSRSRMA